MSTLAGNQTDVAIDTLATDAGGERALTQDHSGDPNEAQTPFPTALVLTREQEDRMVAFALEYVERLEGDMGRVIHPAGTISIPDETTHLGRRELFTLRYYNHVLDREYREGERDTIWKHSNITAALSQRITMQMVARANNFYFGTDPWYSCQFVGTEDKPLAEKIDRHSKWKFDQTRLKDELMIATEFAFVRGESVLKTTHQQKDRFSKRRGMILIGEDGEPVEDSTGNFVFNDSAWINEMEDPAAAQQQATAQPGQPQPVQQAMTMVPTGRKVLKRDPTIELPATPVWKAGLWPVKKRVFHGPECKVVFYKDFLCPLDATTVQDAELICHLYDMPVMDLIEMVKRADLKSLGAGESLAKLKSAIDAIRMLSGAGSDPKAGQRQARTDFAVNSRTGGSPENHLAEIAEVWMSYDADEDGIAEEIMLVLDRKNRFPLFYDHLDNVSPNGLRPFSVVRGKAIDNVWWGMGSMEYFKPEQEFIDLLVNRKNFRMSQAGRTTFWNASCTYEGASQPNLQLNHGKTYRLIPGKTAKDALEYVTLPDEDKELMNLLQFFMQLMQLKSGIINASDQEASGMPTSDTATGIRNVEKSGQEMFSQWLNGLEPGHKAALLANIATLYANLDQEETFRFFAEGSEQTDTLTPEEVADLEFDVTILLTRVRTEQVLQMSAEARALVMEFYTQIPPQVQQAVAQFYQDSLKALGYQDADSIIVDGISPPPTGAPGAPPANGQPAPQQAPGQPFGSPALPPQQQQNSVPAKGIQTPQPPSPRPEESPALI